MQATYKNRILAFNIKRGLSLAKIILIICLLLALMNILTRLFRPTAEPYFFGYFWVYGVLVTINIAYFFYFSNHTITHKKLDTYIVQAYIGSLILIGAIITYIDELIYGHVLMFMIFYILCSVLFIIKLLYMMPFTIITAAIVLKGIFDSPLLVNDSFKYVLFIGTILFIGITMQVLIGKSQRLLVWQQLELEAESEKSKKLAAQLEQSNAELAKANDQLKSVALYDSLTTLPNRYAFFEYVKALIAKRPIHCFIFMIDIDYFKQYNDYYGHPKGDATLAAVAQELSNIGNQHDIYFARWGGEEFIGLSLADYPQAEYQCAQIVHNVCNLKIEHQLSHVSPYLTVSIGGYGGTLTSFDQLYEKADDKLYEVKQQGRNGFILKGV